MRPLDALRFGALVSVLAACGREAVRSNGSEYLLSEPQVVVSAASAVLAAPREIALDCCGNIYLLDRIDRRIVVVSSSGQIRTIGGPGEGPGEFTAPLAFGVDAAGHIRVLDYQRQSIQVFSPAGAILDEHRVGHIGIPSRIRFAPDGGLALSGTRPNGMGGLVSVLDSIGQELMLIGTLISSETDILPTMLDELHRNIVPQFMRNNVLPVFTTAGDIWLFLQTEGILQKFTSDGAMVVEYPVALAEMGTIRSRYFEWYAEVQAPDLLRYFEYVEDAALVDGMLWLLWSTPVTEAGLITIHNDSGRAVTRLVLPPTGVDAPRGLTPSRRRMAIDRDRLRLYLIDQTDVTLKAFPLQRNVFFGRASASPRGSGARSGSGALTPTPPARSRPPLTTGPLHRCTISALQ